MDFTVVEGTVQSGTVDFTASDGTVWRRTGDCNRCGQCCPPCSFFAWSGSLGMCTDRTEANPLYAGGCWVWPNEPWHIEPHTSCSYRFERVT